MIFVANPKESMNYKNCNIIFRKQFSICYITTNVIVCGLACCLLLKQKKCLYFAGEKNWKKLFYWSWSTSLWSQFIWRSKTWGIEEIIYPIVTISSLYLGELKSAGNTTHLTINLWTCDNKINRRWFQCAPYVNLCCSLIVAALLNL